MSFYASREDKPKWIVEQYSTLFQESRNVLDVGCDQRQFANILPEHIDYIGIDISPQADMQFDLDSGERLPISDNEFDLLLCMDTLEHMEHIHFVFDELCRISRKNVLITLPNPLSGAISGYFLGRKYTPQNKKMYGEHMKFYGLPLERPRDRHRWFFNTEESVQFVMYRAHKNNCVVKEIRCAVDVQKSFKRYLKMTASGFQRKRMLNFFNGTTIFLLEKRL